LAARPDCITHRKRDLNPYCKIGIGLDAVSKKNVPAKA